MFLISFSIVVGIFFICKSHTATRNATINVLEGKGILVLEGVEIVLEPGKFIFMQANAPHALKTKENLAFLLTLSAPLTTV